MLTSLRTTLGGIHKVRSGKGEGSLTKSVHLLFQWYKCAQRERGGEIFGLFERKYFMDAPTLAAFDTFNLT